MSLGGSVPPDLDQHFVEGLARLGLPLDAHSRRQLLDYLDLLQKWNRVYNLTAVRDPIKMVSSHLLDSLAVAPHIQCGRLLDTGTGAGLPGVPLAVAWPSTDVTLLDSSQKKAAFLRQVVAQLGLRNVTVVCERVEAWTSARPFDVVVSRAYTDIARFVASTGHVLAPQGLWAAMKGTFPQEELRGLPPHVRVRETVALAIPGLDAARHLVLLERA
jgi:16S rRNA (guanine527-N7)-methyltransferase